MKKLLLTIGSTIAIAAPVVSVIACSQRTEDKINVTVDRDNPKEYKMVCDFGKERDLTGEAIQKEILNKIILKLNRKGTTKLTMKATGLVSINKSIAVFNTDNEDKDMEAIIQEVRSNAEWDKAFKTHEVHPAKPIN